MNPGYGQFGGAPPPQPMGGPPGAVAQNFGAPPLPGAAVAYEFNEFENQSIAKVGGRAKWAGTISLVVGAFGVLAGILMIVVLVIGAANDGVASAAPAIVLSTILPVSIVNLVIGFSLRGAGQSLVEVTTTQGNDVQHMMASLGRLKAAFQLEAIMLVVTGALGFIAGIIMRVA